MASIFGNDRHSDTDKAIRVPCVGDRYTEMFSFDLFVIHRYGDTIATLECVRGEGVVMPRDGGLRIQTLSEFRDRLSYSPGSGSGYWVTLVERGFNVDGWYHFAMERDGGSGEEELADTASPTPDYW